MGMVTQFVDPLKFNCNEPSASPHTTSSENAVVPPENSPDLRKTEKLVKTKNGFAAAFNSYSFTKCMAVCVQTYGADNFKSEL